MQHHRFNLLFSVIGRKLLLLFILINTSFLISCGSDEGITIVTKTGPQTAATATINFATKLFRFSWVDVSDATHYKLLENPDGASGFTQVSGDIPQGTQIFDYEVALYSRVNAQYILQSCDDSGCTDDTPILIDDNIAQAIGMFNADNTSSGDRFGNAVSLSADGNSLAIGADGEDGTNDSLESSGAVYVFVRSGNEWLQQAYLKAHNAGAEDYFGSSVSLSADGDTLAVGAYGEDSSANGITSFPGGVIPTDDDATVDSGAVYVFSRSGGIWSQQAYLKPHGANSDAGDKFGSAVSLSADGNTLAVGMPGEDGWYAGILSFPITILGGTETVDTGVVYMFSRSGSNWNYQTYIATLLDQGDYFGTAVDLSADGNSLAVGAVGDDSNTTGIDTTPDDDGTADDSGAVYVFNYDGSNWQQQVYLKAHNTGVYDSFGSALSLSSDGSTLAVGAYLENGTSPDDIAFPPVGNASEVDSGAVYIFNRSGVDWSQQAYLKAEYTGTADYFGFSVSLSADGNTLVTGAYTEDSNGIGLNPAYNDNSFSDKSGAAYTFIRNSGIWSRQTYLKASNTSAFGFFGAAITLSASGETLVIGARGADSFYVY